MDQVSITKRQFRNEQWRKRITECLSSGMSVKKWCELNGVSEGTHYYYLKKFRLELCDTLPVPVETHEKPVAFKKLEGKRQII